MSSGFVDEVLAGDALWTEVDDWVDRWHEADGPGELHEFLGMTWPEYQLWVEQPSALRVILGARERAEPIETFLEEADEYAFAARGLTTEQRDLVRQWLRRTGRLRS